MRRSPVLTVSWLTAGRAVVERCTRLGAFALLIAGLTATGPALAAPAEPAGPGGSAGSDSDTGHDAAAAPTSAPAPVGDPPPPPEVDFDRLMRLPSSYTSGAARQGGATASDWRVRFAEADASLADAKQSLSDAQSKLEHTAADSSQWQMGAPGLGTPDAEHATVSYKLRAEIRSLREELAQAEKKRKDLAIEADLSGVPDSWRRPEGDSTPRKPGTLPERAPDRYAPSSR